MPTVRWFNLISILLVLLAGCSLRATVVDRSEFSTEIKNIHLTGFPAIRIYHGGAIRELPLKSLRMIDIDGTETLTHENEFFLSATIELKDGRRIASTGKRGDNRSFVSVNNTLAGESGGGYYSLSLDNLRQLIIR